MAHKSILAKENVTVEFFLPNMTSVVQPMDQSTIKNLKHFFRYLVDIYRYLHLLTESFQKLHITFLNVSRMCLNARSKVRNTVPSEL